MSLQRKSLLALLFVLHVFVAEAGFDSRLLDALPARKAQALAAHNAAPTDTSSQINGKREAYYLELKKMVKDLQSHYYFHDEFPKDVCAGIEQHAVVLAGLEYPFSSVAGASAYDALIVKAKIELADDLICRMTRSIYEHAPRGSNLGKPANKPPDAYRVWLKKWNARKPA